MVEFAYRAVPERDGFVGLFHGGSARGATLDAVRDAVGDVAEPVLDITGVELVDNGSTVLARMTLAADIPEEVADGTITYRIFLQFGEYDCRMGIEVTTSGRVPSLYDGGCGPPPGDFGRVQGATVEIVLLQDAPPRRGSLRLEMLTRFGGDGISTMGYSKTVRCGWTPPNGTSGRWRGR